MTRVRSGKQETSSHRLKSSGRVIKPLWSIDDERRHADFQLAASMEQLIMGLDIVLSSTRWRIGNAFGTTLNRVLRRPRRPLAADRIRQICMEFPDWKAAVLAAPAPNEFFQGELHQLDQWIEELGQAWDSLMKSRRWKAGSLIVELVQGGQPRSGSPNSIPHIDELIRRYNKYRHDFPEVRTVAGATCTDYKNRLNIAHEESTWWNQEASTDEQTLLLRQPGPGDYSWFECLRKYENHWRETANAYKEAVKYDQASANWFFRFGYAWENCGQWAEAAKAYERATHLDPTQPNCFYRFANACEWDGRWTDAADLYEKAVQLDPMRSSWFYRLGRARERTPVTGVRFLHDIGLRLEKQGDWPAAASAYSAAIGIDNQQPCYHIQLANVQEKMGDFKNAVGSCEKAAQLDPTETRWLEQLGHMRKRCLDFEGARDAFQRLLEIKPDHSRARMSLYPINLKLCRWAEAFEDALSFHEQREFSRSQPMPASSQYPDALVIRQLRAAFESEEVAIPRADAAELLRNAQAVSIAARLPVNWWFALHLRLKRIGWFSLAYQVKDIAASLIVSRSVELENVGITNYLEVAKAHFQLGSTDAAIEHLQPILNGDIGDGEAQVAAVRLAADMDAFRGNFAKHRDALRIHDGVNKQQAETVFREMVANRTVAIVGPVIEGRHNGAEIDSYDVVIRTNVVASAPRSERVFDAQGSRTDISYFSSFVSQELFGEIQEAVENRHISMAVMPPSIFAYRRQLVSEPGDLRYNPGEPTAFLRAMSFAIQRIVHDIFRYSPSSVKIFNVDFFVTSAAYKKNYRVAELLADIDPNYLGSNHDYRSDFEFMKCLREQSIVKADADVHKLLGRTTDEYLALLDQAQDSVTASVSR